MWRKHLDTSQTIFALTTGNLPSAVAIFKISGPQAFEVAGKIFHPQGGAPWTRAARVSLGTLVDGDGEKIDDPLVLSFLAPHSHSGEDTVEFHCHGAPPIIQALQQTVLNLGARPAEAGEFSYRALLNGKMTAEAAEDLADVFLAKESLDLRRIYHRRDGALERQVLALRDDLITLQALFDTAVDFSEEYSSVSEGAGLPLERVILGCSTIIQRYSSFQAGRQVPRLVLAGRPNAGKSSLFNALLCRYRAIVHEEPGTTRDVIEEDVEIGGRGWKVVDTAGIREDTLGAERQGIELGEDFLSASSFWLLVIDGSVGFGPEETALLERFGQKAHLVVWNKMDLRRWESPPPFLKNVVSVSAFSGENLPALWAAIKERLPQTEGQEAGPLPSASQSARLQVALGKLETLRWEWQNKVPAEFLAESNRQILTVLDSVVGEVGTEDVLDRIFNEFCIGK